MRRWVIFGVAAVVLLLLAAPLVALYYAAFTEEGLAFVVSRIPHRVANANLSITGARGTIARGMHVDRVEIDHERVHLRFENIDGRIRLAPLILQTLRSPDLKIGNVLVEIRPRKTPIVRYEPRFLPRGLKIQADAITVSTGALVLQSGRRYDLSQVRASGVASAKTIRFYKAEGSWESWRIETAGKLKAADPMKIDGSARLNWRIQGQPPWVIAATMQGNLDVLDLTAQFTAPLRADFTGQALDLTSRWHWEGKSRIHDLDIRTWGASGVLGRITGELAVKGDASGFSGVGPLTPEGLRVGIFDSVFEGSYANRTVTADRIDITHRASRANATGKGTIAIAPNGPSLQLEGNWKGFRWPLVGKDIAVNSASGHYVMSGVWPYDVRGEGVLQTTNLNEPLRFEMMGQLDKRRLVVTDALVNAFDGEVNLSGQVTWAPNDTWSASGNAMRINPERLRADLPGKLNFAFEAAGLGFGADKDFTVRVARLSGQLRNLPASGEGTISRRGATWEYQNIKAELGRTQLALNGSVNGQFDLRFALETQDLGLLDANSRGQLRAQGILRGTLAEPIVNATAAGSLLRYKDLTVSGFDAVVDFDPRRVEKSTIDIRAHDLAYGERKIDQLQFALDGTAADHALKMNLTAPGLKMQSRAQGAYIKGIWRGQLNQILVNGSEQLHLELEAPINVQLSADAVNVEQLCLKGSPARLCADGEWSPEKWAARMLASDMPMSTFTAGLTPDVDYKGILNISAQAFATGDEAVQGNLRAELRDAQISHRLASGRVEIITLGSGTVTANATTESITGKLSLDAGEVGTIKGRIVAARTSDLWKEMPLDGELHAHTAELDFLSLYVPQIDRAAGRIAMDLNFSGWAGEPLVNGVVALTDGELDLYQINLALRGVGIEARLTDNGLDFSGTAKMGQGRAQAKGHLTWRDSKPYGRVNLLGENLRVANIPEAQIDASPNLDFRIDGERIAVTGTVKVPQARIVPADLTNAVRTSSDEIIVGELATPYERSEVVSNITLTLGDRVDIDTSGLKGRLTGSITVRSGYEEITRATGELNVEDGEYTAYGRRLDIERGRLIFTGGPVANPGIDIRAQKKFEEVVAGVNVRGTLLLPRMTFFSEPSLPQSQIVQLILAGGTVQSAQTKNVAGNELLAQGGAILAQQIGSRVGIEDVGIESSLTNETSIVLGKYLSPKLYVSYGISLTESLNTLKLRYTLGDHWTIKTEFGEEGGADLVYTIDK
jgi:translocation and assembly module TamB